MLHEPFHGRDLAEALALGRAKLGEDAMILRTQTKSTTRGSVVEVVATTVEDLDSFRARLERAPTRIARSEETKKPYTVGFVGPTGSGKTTSAIKAALHPDAHGERRVGLITLDTYRVGAIDEFQTYAEIAGLPLEVIYSIEDIEPALDRLKDVEVLIVDTPGRAPSAPEGPIWRNLLRGLYPDEVHLVIPAGLRTDVAMDLREEFVLCGTTHTLLSKVDEVPGESGIAELVDALGLPARWVSTGQDVPLDLERAAPRLIASLTRRGGSVGKGERAHIDRRTRKPVPEREAV